MLHSFMYRMSIEGGNGGGGCVKEECMYRELENMFVDIFGSNLRILFST